MKKKSHLCEGDFVGGSEQGQAQMQGGQKLPTEKIPSVQKIPCEQVGCLNPNVEHIQQVHPRSNLHLPAKVLCDRFASTFFVFGNIVEANASPCIADDVGNQLAPQ